MAVFPQAQEDEVEAGRTRGGGSEKLPEPRFIAPGALPRRGAAVHGMHLARGDGHLPEQRLPGHKGVAPGIVGGDAALIPPEDVGPGPVHPFPVGSRGQQLISAPGGGAPGQGDAEAAPGRHRLPGDADQQLRGAPAQGLRIIEDADQVCPLVGELRFFGVLWFLLRGRPRLPYTI